MNRLEIAKGLSKILYTQSLGIDCMLLTPPEARTAWARLARVALAETANTVAKELQIDPQEFWEEVLLGALAIMRRAEGPEAADRITAAFRASALKTAPKPADLG
jgi:hypothetical protein